MKLKKGYEMEKVFFYANDDELTEISESMTFSAELVGNKTLMETTLSEDRTEEQDASEDSDNKPSYPTVTVTVSFAFFTIKHNLPTEVIGNTLSLISLALSSPHCLPNTVNNGILREKH